jgi:hypothetical protein
LPDLHGYHDIIHGYTNLIFITFSYSNDHHLKNIFEKKLLIYLFLLEKYYFCSVFNNNENKMKALYDTYFFFFYYFYFSNKVKREFVCVR